MSHYRGNMRNLRATMENAHGALGRLAEISRNVAQAANGATRRNGMGRLGATSWTSASPISDSDNVSNIASVTQQATGNTVVRYTDGTIAIFNAQGQNVTSNYITTPAGTTPLQNAAIAVDEATGSVATTATNAINSATSAVGSALSTAGSIGQSLLVIGVIVAVIYAANEMEAK